MKQMQSYDVISEVQGKCLTQPPRALFRKGESNRSQGITSQTFTSNPHKNADQIIKDVKAPGR